MFATVMLNTRWKISPYKAFIIQGHTFVKTCIVTSRLLFLRQRENVLKNLKDDKMQNKNKA